MDLAKTIYQRFWNPRSCPAIMFYLEGLSKLTFFWLVAVVAHSYGNQGDSVVALYKHEGGGLQSAEAAVVIFWVSSVVYEFGQLLEIGWRWESYLNDTWNRLDLLSLGLLGIWIAAEFFVDSSIRSIALCLSAIPLAFLQLQYLSQIKSLGRLIIAILRISTDLLNFMVVYFVCIIGFGASFLGLFHNNSGGQYKDTYHTFMTLFGSSLSSVTYVFDDNIVYANSTADSHPNIVLNDVGRAVYIAFVTISAVILLNLLVAIMSNTFQAVNDKALQEWSYLKACTTQKMLLVEERNPLCMLPPPLNLATSAFAPFQHLCIKISLCGTVANCILGIISAVPRAAAATYAFSTFHWYTKRPEQNTEQNYSWISVILLVFGTGLYLILSFVLAAILFPLVLAGCTLLAIIHFSWDFVVYIKEPEAGETVLDSKSLSCFIDYKVDFLFWALRGQTSPPDEVQQHSIRQNRSQRGSMMEMTPLPQKDYPRSAGTVAAVLSSKAVDDVGAVDWSARNPMQEVSVDNPVKSGGKEPDLTLTDKGHAKAPLDLKFFTEKDLNHIFAALQPDAYNVEANSAEPNSNSQEPAVAEELKELRGIIDQQDGELIRQAAILDRQATILERQEAALTRQESMLAEVLRILQARSSP